MSVYLGGLIVDTTPDRRRDLVVSIQPDPRISNQRPAWLTDDREWRDQLESLDLDEDIRWVERHWDMAGGPDAAVDTSWITFEKVGVSMKLLNVLGVIGIVACIGLLVVMALVVAGVIPT